jgi:hypothetical protein
MAQTRGTFSSLYDNVDKAFFSIMKDRLNELPRIYPKTFSVKTSNRKFERVVTYVPFGDTMSKPEGEPYVMDTLREGYTKDFTHTENGLGFEVTQTAFEDDTEGILDGAGRWLAFSARYVEEGRAAPVTDLQLIVPPALEFLADRLLNSTGLPGSADNDRNPIKSRRSWSLIVNPRLSDQDAWFIVAADKGSHGLSFYRRVPISTVPLAIDARTDNRILKIRHRFSVGAWSWVGAYGSAGA